MKELFNIEWTQHRSSEQLVEHHCGGVDAALITRSLDDEPSQNPGPWTLKTTNVYKKQGITEND